MATLVERKSKRGTGGTSSRDLAWVVFNPQISCYTNFLRFYASSAVLMKKFFYQESLQENDAKIDSTFTGCGGAWVEEGLVPVKGAGRASDGSRVRSFWSRSLRSGTLRSRSFGSEAKFGHFGRGHYGPGHFGRGHFCLYFRH